MITEVIIPTCADEMLLLGSCAAFLTQRNVEEAAKVVGVSANTLLNWMKLPEFQTALRQARRAVFGQTIARLQQASGAAASLLLKIIVDTNVGASTRVRAADIVLDKAAKAIEIEDIEARVTALEAATGNGQQRR